MVGVNQDHQQCNYSTEHISPTVHLSSDLYIYPALFSIYSKSVVYSCNFSYPKSKRSIKIHWHQSS